MGANNIRVAGYMCKRLLVVSCANMFLSGFATLVPCLICQDTRKEVKADKEYHYKNFQLLRRVPRFTYISNSTHLEANASVSKWTGV